MTIEAILARLLGVSEVQVHSAEIPTDKDMATLAQVCKDEEGYRVSITLSSRQKCLRCWRYDADKPCTVRLTGDATGPPCMVEMVSDDTSKVEGDPKYMCTRCIEVVRDLGVLVE